ncbi:MULTISPECIES: hypothetical protein [Pseudofrankia]|uniref:hypothetical protein n=1 Tax=Pseudofrankia TaxID=2994363 RepID=UPI000307F299|nr:MULTISPECIES: hypothetical protein [Pseudofrankia]OHV33585.1 hypothetical protein BCD49_26510 [Pseudofrankia sp. EUN1h]
MEAFYGRPECLLDPTVREAQSAWGHIASDAAARAADRLRAGVVSGAWDRRHAAPRHQPALVGSPRLVTACR